MTLRLGDPRWRIRGLLKSSWYGSTWMRPNTASGERAICFGTRLRRRCSRTAYIRYTATHPGAKLQRHAAADGCDSRSPSLAAISDENGDAAQTL